MGAKGDGMRRMRGRSQLSGAQEGRTKMGADLQLKLFRGEGGADVLRL